MNIEDYNIICSTKMFDGLSQNVMAQIIGNKSVQKFEKGPLMFQQGDDAENFYVIISGWVKLFRQLPSGEEAILHMPTTGETVAEAAMFEKQNYPTFAEVIADARLLAINCERFKHQLTGNPEIALHMLASTTTICGNSLLKLNR